MHYGLTVYCSSNNHNRNNKKRVIHQSCASTDGSLEMVESPLNLLLFYRDCAIITWRGAGGGGGGLRNQRGKGHRGKAQPERGGGGSKLNLIDRGGGALLFSLFFTNRKSGRGAIRVQIFIPFLFFKYLSQFKLSQ